MDISQKDLAKLLLSSSPEGILIINQDGEIIKVNDSLIQMFGYSDKSELLNKKMEILIPNKFLHNHKKHREGFQLNPSKRKIGGNNILYGKKKDGSEFAVEIGLNHLKSNNSTFISAIVNDISERLEIQKKLTQLNYKLEEKVAERTSELKNAILELQDSNHNLEIQYEKTKSAQFESQQALSKEKELGELKSRFVSMASHEFRTPLSTVLSSNSLIQKYIDKSIGTDTGTKEKVFKHYNRISKSIKNLNEILNDLLSLGKIEEGKIKTTKEPFCIHDLYDELKEEMSTFLKPHQILEIKHEGGSNINSDRHLIHNILINLTSNASKYSKDGKTIKIESFIKSHLLTIKVIDQGIGIPSSDFEHMFDRFFRAKNSTNIQGTGLGLNIVKNYLELINGTITFASELNIGSTFTLIIETK